MSSPPATPRPHALRPRPDSSDSGRRSPSGAAPSTSGAPEQRPRPSVLRRSALDLQRSALDLDLRTSVPRIHMEPGRRRLAQVAMEEAIDGAMTRRFELEWTPFWTGTSYFAPYLPVGTTLSLLEVAMLSGAIGVLPPVGFPIPSRTIMFVSHGDYIIHQEKKKP